MTKRPGTKEKIMAIQTLKAIMAVSVVEPEQAEEMVREQDWAMAVVTVMVLEVEQEAEIIS